MSRLYVNSKLYESLVWRARQLERQGDPNVLEFIERVAGFAWNLHPGRFADGAIENIALRIGRRLPGAKRIAAPPVSLEQGSKVLHVVTTVQGTGGCSRLLTKWMQCDPGSSHVVVVTRQHGPLAEVIAREWTNVGAVWHVLSSGESIEQRALQLAAHGRQAGRIVLHTTPDDVTPVVAFARPDLCPVAMCNHAHFWFSLGLSCSDIVLNTLPYYSYISRQHRGAPRTALLRPIANIWPFRGKVIDKEAAKMALGFAARTPVALAMGSRNYFTPAAGCDFFETAGRLLAADSSFQLLFVGILPDDELVPLALRRHPRARFMGRIEDPRGIFEAADVCLSPFPMPSLGALVDGVIFGEAFPVLGYGQAENILLPRMDFIDDGQARPVHADDYVKHVTQLLLQQAETRRRAVALRRNVEAVDASFAGSIQQIYAAMDKLTHQPEEIPVRSCSHSHDSWLMAEVGNRRVWSSYLACFPQARKLWRAMRPARRN